jgi:hypothetical protein
MFIVVAALGCAAAVPATVLGAAAKLGPAPIQSDCLTYRGPAPCMYNIGFIEMRLSKHLLHVGDKLTADYSWGLTPTRGATPLRSGVGLSRVKGGCKIPPTIALGSAGSATCTWKATRPTGGWVTSLGINLSQNASLGSYTENDYYAVIGKEPAIEGWVRIEDSNSAKSGLRPGVPNVQVKINGPRFGRSVRTNQDGYYFAELQNPGKYRVTPKLTKKYKNGKLNSVAISPESKVVSVSDNQIGRADFKVEDGLKVTATPDRAKVAADGLQVVKVDVQAERFGDPLQGATLMVIPNRESVGANPQTIPVPARYCVGGGLVWPNGDRANQTLQAPFPIYTDDKGKASFTLQTGTVPGKLGLYVWAQDANTATLRTTNINDARADVTIDNESTGSGSTTDVGKALGKAAKAKGFAAPTDVISLSDLLIKNASADPGLGGLAFAPVYGSAMYGVLVMPATQRISPQPGTYITASADSTVITPEALDPLIAKLYGGPLASGYSGWWSAVLGGAMPNPPSYGSWAAGVTAKDTTGWSLKEQTGKVYYLGGWSYLGYPYDRQAGGC